MLYIKLLIEQSLDCKETEIKITCSLIDDRLNKLIEQIKLYAFSIIGYIDGISTPIALENIYYFESVDNKTFLYLNKEVYRCNEKLYELEKHLADTTFVRISKNCILNISVVRSVRAQFSGRLEAKLLNDEKVVVSKHYIKAFKDKFINEGV